MTDNDEHSSLLKYEINYGIKMFDNSCPWMSTCSRLICSGLGLPQKDLNMKNELHHYILKLASLGRKKAYFKNLLVDIRHGVSFNYSGNSW